ncbi:MAG: NeuD/PglB/VioB family sugar acetyltransferase [Bryobacteraceae bacterium]
MTQRLRLVVAGAGGHGAEVQAYVRDLAREGWSGQLLGFLDDGVPAGRCRNLEILGALDSLAGRPAEFFDGLYYITALGSNATRRKVVERIEALYGGRILPWTLTHPAAWLGEEIEIGAGTLLAPGVLITTRVRVGRHSILNVKVSISHDCFVGDFVNLNPGVTVCGNVTIGEGAYIGTGATLIDKVSVGEGAIIGGGAVVIDDIPDHVTAVGVPARVIKRHG